MLIASFNVNSIRARLEGFLRWLDVTKPDIVLLQEVKAMPEDFPLQPFHERGYQILLKGQKSYNGVAILSREPAELIRDTLPVIRVDSADELGSDFVNQDQQARFIEAKISGIHVVSLYLPNGNPIQSGGGQEISEKFLYKLSWMQRLNHYIKVKMAAGEPMILGGDFNVCRQMQDLYDPKQFTKDALTHSETKRLFHGLLGYGMIDAWRALHPFERGYTYWDLWKSRFQRDEGLRIDYFLLSPQIADRLQACYVDKQPRESQKPSDHTPLMLIIADH